MPEMLSEHFSLEELTATQVRTADNTPGPRELANLYSLAVELEKLREKVGPLHVNSGYRSPEVNRIVGGAKTSYHQKGLAADLFPLAHGMTLRKLLEEAVATVDFDQIIYEFGRWIHVGIPEAGVRGRKQVLMILKSGHYEPFDAAKLPR